MLDVLRIHNMDQIASNVTNIFQVLERPFQKMLSGLMGLYVQHVAELATRQILLLINAKIRLM